MITYTLNNFGSTGVCIINIAEVFIKFGPLIGSFIGAIAAIVAIMIKFHLDKKRKQGVIRRAFKADLETAQTPLEVALGNIEEADNSAENLDIESLSSLASPVSEGLFNQVGLLDSDESVALISYYRLLDATIGAIKSLKELEEEDSVYANFPVQEKVSNLLNRNKNTVDMLEDKLD